MILHWNPKPPNPLEPFPLFLFSYLSTGIILSFFSRFHVAENLYKYIIIIYVKRMNTIPEPIGRIPK